MPHRHEDDLTLAGLGAGVTQRTPARTFFDEDLARAET